MMNVEDGGGIGTAMRDAGGRFKRIAEYAPNDLIFEQDDACSAVMYVQHGDVQLSTIGRSGQEGVTAIIGRGAFFGEGCLLGKPTRTSRATAITRSSIIEIDKAEMIHALRHDREFSSVFMAHLLSRHSQYQEDLANHMVNGAERRLALAMLRLARSAEPDGSRRWVPHLSQETWANMVGTTRSRVNYFMNGFKKQGRIEHAGNSKGGIFIIGARLDAVAYPELEERPSQPRSGR